MAALSKRVREYATKIDERVTVTAEDAVETGVYGDRLYYVDAPEGMVWKESRTHCLTVSTYRGDPEGNRSEVEDVIERMDYGLGRCDCDDCGTLDRG